MNETSSKELIYNDFLAGPCPPTNIRASLQCAGNVGHVTWDAALRAEMYDVATVPSVTDEHVHNCSTSGTNCSLTDLHCGETVAITVVTTERGCRSEPSDPLMFKTGQSDTLGFFLNDKSTCLVNFQCMNTIPTQSDSH